MEADPLRSQVPLSRHPWMTCLKHKNIAKDSHLEPRPTCLLVWTQRHILSQDRWWEQLGSFGQWFYDQCIDPRVCWGSLLGFSLLSSLFDGTLSVNGFSGLFSRSLGYIIIRVQVEGVWGCDEYQVALVVPDPWDPGCQSFWSLQPLTKS